MNANLYLLPAAAGDAADQLTSCELPVLTGQFLTEQEWAVLRFEKQWSQRAPLVNPGLKQRAVRQFLGLNWTQYYRTLNQALDHPEAEAFAPALVRQLRRLRMQSA